MLRHPFIGVGLAYEEVISFEIMHIISYHSKEGEAISRSLEAVILHHIDFINF